MADERIEWRNLCHILDTSKHSSNVDFLPLEKLRCGFVTEPRTCGDIEMWSLAVMVVVGALLHCKDQKGDKFIIAQ